MEKPISRRAHGLLELPVVLALYFLPNIAGFQDNDMAVTIARIMAAAVLGLTLFTRAEWGLVRVIPYRVHLTIDVMAGLFAVAAPWIFGFADDAHARWAFVAAGATVVVAAGLLSKPEEMPAHDAGQGSMRHAH